MRSPLASPPFRGAAYGLAAAALFGISIPVAKLLLPEGGPLLVAGLLYLGAGLGLLAFKLMASRGRGVLPREAKVRPSDLWLLAGIIGAGGILGPVLMLWGLQRLSAVLSSLLLNLEAPLTIVLAVMFFREQMGRLEVAGALLIVVAAAVLGYQPEEMRADLWGFLAIVGACLCWALDNNLTQRLSLRDPVAVTWIKALGAGTCTLSLALVTQQRFPGALIIMAALALGVVSYGLSLVLDTLALRYLGAAREAGFFATAPFMGAVAAIPVLGERWGTSEVLAAVFMGGGVALLLRAHHGHAHRHEALEHEHAHVHGEHHAHAHEEPEVVAEQHAHTHRHLPLAHNHAHVSEIHHRHEH